MGKKSKRTLQIGLILVCIILVIVNFYVQSIEESETNKDVWYLKHKRKLSLVTTACLALFIGIFIFLTCGENIQNTGGMNADTIDYMGGLSDTEATLHKSDSYNYESTEY